MTHTLQCMQVPPLLLNVLCMLRCGTSIPLLSQSTVVPQDAQLWNILCGYLGPHVSADCYAKRRPLCCAMLAHAEHIWTGDNASSLLRNIEVLNCGTL